MFSARVFSVTACRTLRKQLENSEIVVNRRPRNTIRISGVWLPHVNVLITRWRLFVNQHQRRYLNAGYINVKNLSV
jgi:hypothetical protein